eukprot:1989287-Rhodomonas_salina.1
MEGRLRDALYEVYFGKTKQVRVHVQRSSWLILAVTFTGWLVTAACCLLDGLALAERYPLSNGSSVYSLSYSYGSSVYPVSQSHGSALLVSYL